LVEYKLPKLGVASSNLVARSISSPVSSILVTIAGMKAFAPDGFYGLVDDGIHNRFENGNGLFARFCFLFDGNMAKRTGKPKKKAGIQAAHPSDAIGQERQRALVATVTRLAEPLCSAEGLELVHVEYQREPGGLTLRCFLDRLGGVTLDDCVNVSRQLEDILEVHLQDVPPYRLEVSSPGIDRPVGKLEDFIRFKGHRAKIRVGTAVNGRKNFTGILVGVIDEMIQLQADKETFSLNFNDITRARLINYNGEH
jgi:ribosome maturation factor RimP